MYDFPDEPSYSVKMHMPFLVIIVVILYSIKLDCLIYV
uniref:Uncharacterized protein n=1 Tax=Arundo donax TaxID=35708 RepID=A0A0A9FPP3_ARUDO